MSTTIPGPIESTPPPSLQRGAKTAKLLEVIGGARKVVILPHDNPDPDSLASAAALRNLIQLKLKGRTVVFGAGGIVARAENRALLSHLDVSLVPAKQCLTAFKGPVILVDTQPGRKNNSLPAGVVPAAVIDHHPDWEQRGRSVRRPPRELRRHLDDLTEYLREAEVPIEPRVATAPSTASRRKPGSSTRNKAGDIVAHLYPTSSSAS